MKDYKLLLAGLILLSLLLIAVFVWLWSNNRKNTDPLPIMSNNNKSVAMLNEDETNILADSLLYLQVENNLRAPLADIITRFESRYPHVQVVANYVSTSDIITLSKNNNHPSKPDELVFSIDMIIANNISRDELSILQKELNIVQDNTFNDADKLEARTLNSFNYAVKDNHTLEGVILTDNTTAIKFRNFLLSSTGQDILKSYDYDNIEGYKNSVDELFNPAKLIKTDAETTSVNVADALSNGK
ncbi:MULTISPECIES: hypothetical protein [unclassified Psychrobacter]|uniref:hypothetical protein n=1 Tax=unclassified Psychrobacter TaxID=196806 RepID=UPI001787F1C0|nr:MULTISPECIES: hypothetical protein [unclassified Psychrobacter]MBE0440639.1 hypothetical protein [Psychrobacter sp. FME13]